ncbi:MAG TPA: hypothetical protein VEF34_10245 [Syntrophobacteraceae bacterium]|nr:hypothetical protein [Syntrophobacteraceae bacterium]
MQSASIQTFINRYGISMHVSRLGPAKSGGACPKTALDRYRCQLSRPGKEIDVLVSVPPEEGAVTPSDVLFMLILDASGCEMLKEYYARQDELRQIFPAPDAASIGLDEFWLEYRSRWRQTRKFRTFLGENLYRKLLDRFGFNN